ncbi:L,D-transpeptidase [Pseudoxanthobacter sp.]|uniref:L,D-transpeptidase n=1 Tax=Pseudoxanthobacter sp. TaxID=1925742 RepID=UPI002FE32C57
MRRLVTFFGACATVAGLSAIPALADQRQPAGQFYDPNTKTWVTYYETQAEMEKREQAKFARATVPLKSDEAPGTVIVDTVNRYLYLIQPDDQAIRYGIGVGKEGFEWSGVERVARKAEWPGWTPPAEMLQRRPDLPRYMAGGPKNPLGARALYLGNTLYRIHGTNENWSIGKKVSSGCIRLRNADVEDLYSRVDLGAKVIVIGPNSKYAPIPVVDNGPKPKPMPAPALLPRAAT